MRRRRKKDLKGEGIKYRQYGGERENNREEGLGREIEGGAGRGGWREG